MTSVISMTSTNMLGDRLASLGERFLFSWLVPTLLSECQSFSVAPNEGRLGFFTRYSNTSEKAPGPFSSTFWVASPSLHREVESLRKHWSGHCCLFSDEHSWRQKLSLWKQGKRRSSRQQGFILLFHFLLLRGSKIFKIVYTSAIWSCFLFF